MRTALCLLVIISSLSGIGYAAEVYWDRDNIPEPVITDKDFKLEYGSPKAKSMGELEIYNEPKPPIVTRMDEPEEDDIAAPAPMPAPRASEREPSAVTPKQDTKPRVTDIKPAQRKSVKPAGEVEAAPSRQLQPPENEAPAVQTEPEVAPPPAKKMPWGQKGDNQTKEESKPKFQWGR
jgi:hypothetical protein